MRSTIILSSTFLFLALLTGCKKEDNIDPCFSSPAPHIALNSWPTGLHPDSTWVVAYDDLPLNIYVMADGSSDPADVKLNSVNVVILATAGDDSTMYQLSQSPNNFSATINTTATIGTVTANVPAQLRINTANSCGYNGALVRQLLITP